MVAVTQAEVDRRYSRIRAAMDEHLRLSERAQVNEEATREE